MVVNSLHSKGWVTLHPLKAKIRVVPGYLPLHQVTSIEKQMTKDQCSLFLGVGCSEGVDFFVLFF